MKWLAISAFLALAATAVAQTAPAPAAEPDLAIITNVQARELRFDDKPVVHVTVSGDVNGRPAAIVSRTDRVNLPDPVQPHVTYRDIGIRLTITSTLPDIETILDEALGPTPAPATQPPAPQPAVRHKKPKR